MNKFLLEIVVFIAGAVVMMFELAGTRIVAPYLGTSVFIWTSLIGIILGSLSIGYWLGGKFSDKKPNITVLSMILLIAAGLIGITIILKDIVLFFLLEMQIGIRTSSVIAAIILFAPASILLGMVSPYAVKLKINDLNTSGSTVGNLYAISTVGSIVGTFLAGFYLIPFLGSTNILLFLSALLVFLSIATSLKKLSRKRSLVITTFAIFAAFILSGSLIEKELIDVETYYNRVLIYNSVDEKTGKEIKSMRINNESSSAMFIESDDLVYEYTKYYRLAKHFNPDLTNSLMLGGAAYSYPKDYLDKFPQAHMDVVEIDPGVTELAKKYFRLEDDPRLVIYHEDGRVFLNRAPKEKYDTILIDTFTSFSPPYQLTTEEALRLMHGALNDDGVIIANIISSLEGESSKFLRAEYRTFAEIFPQVYLFPVNHPDNTSKVQNIMLVALKSKEEPLFESADPELDSYLTHLWKKEIPQDLPILKDDHAPVDHYMSEVIKRM